MYWQKKRRPSIRQSRARTPLDRTPPDYDKISRYLVDYSTSEEDTQFLQRHRSNIPASTPSYDDTIPSTLKANDVIARYSAAPSESHRSLSTQSFMREDNIGPFNTIELVSIAIIILLIISLFVYHCHKASNIEANLNESRHNAVKQRRAKIMRRRSSFSKSASFASNLASVMEEPEIFDTRLADELNKKEMEEKQQESENGSPSSYLEPWYKWLQHDSPKNGSQQINKQHQSANDINTNDIDDDINNKQSNTCIQIMNKGNNRKCNYKTTVNSYLISVNTKNLDKRDQEGEIPRSASCDSFF